MKILLPGTLVLLLFQLLSAQSAGDDIILGDFEDGTYNGWHTEGTAFGDKPSRGEGLRPGPYSGFMGRFWAHSFRPLETPGEANPHPLRTCMPNTGKLISPEFTIERPFINFLIGGGNSIKDNAVRLIVGGKVVREATGPMGPMEKQPRLEWRTWDVSQLQGKKAHIEVADESPKQYLMADHFVQSPANYAESPAKRTLTVDKDWMHLPVSQKARLALINLKAEGVPTREFEIALAPQGQEPDFWVYEDMRAYRGKTLEISADWLPDGDAGLSDIVLSDDLPQQKGIYREKQRPLFHYTAMRGRIADPVGLVWHNGEYHMFLEHWSYGNNQQAVRHWGHAVSKDLIHWEELPAAIYTDELGTIFSGCSVEDKNNTSGFGKDGKAPLVCIYTSAGGWSPINYGKPAAQSLAYSNDNGRTFEKYAGNPALPNFMGGNRDPKVMWHEPSQQWFMALYLQNSRYKFFTSKNLKEWEPHGELHIPGIIENPDLYAIALDGDPGKQKWIFSANGVYCVGNFDGDKFTIEEGPFSARQWCNTWAEQTFDNQPQGRRIQMAYLQRARWNGEAFSHQVTFPRELTLRSTPKGPRLYAWPVREIEQLYGQTWGVQNLKLGGLEAIPEASGEALDIDATFELNSPDAMPVLVVKGEKIWYDAAAKTLHCQQFSAPLEPEGNRVNLRILADRASLEIFGNGGIVCLSTGVNQPAKTLDVKVGVLKGAATATDIKVREIKSIWQPFK